MFFPLFSAALVTPLETYQATSQFLLLKSPEHTRTCLLHALLHRVLHIRVEQHSLHPASLIFNFSFSLFYLLFFTETPRLRRDTLGTFQPAWRLLSLSTDSRLCFTHTLLTSAFSPPQLLRSFSVSYIQYTGTVVICRAETFPVCPYVWVGG